MDTLPVPGVRRPAARMFALVAALFWGVLFFGIVDLLVVPTQNEQFLVHYLLETGWGLLYTVLVMLPLVAWHVRPHLEVFLQQVLAVAAAVLLTGVAALALGQVLVAALLAGTALAPAALAARSSTGVLQPPSGSPSRALGTLALAAGASAAVYATQMVHASFTGAYDELTWGLEHLPMQAGFGLALAGTAGISVLAGAAGAPGWRLSALLPALSAVWFGIVSVRYPGHLGSLGTVGGVAAVVWGVVFALAAVLVRRTDRA